ncbi:hypothetical protein [Acanthopleuribacter pedis]|uniref:Tetratricopeptide repeat protein n=1 Tax=Acanthopleuribacter pedis TaxID=442870 RepID=A0A8J7QJF4_9BACT|nr:hypothetical protein [Acanthopleuribacter pedis]MBO1321956.1 hypothetical protein [Acanthopleuribacter pedis]
MDIANAYGAEQAHAYFNDCHFQTQDPMCFYGLAYTWYMMGENDKSIEMVEYLLAAQPAGDKFNGHCWALMGANRIWMREFEAAQEPLEKALAYYKKAGHKRNMFKVLVQLGNGKLRAGHLEEADRYFERATFLAISEKVNKGHLYSLRGISAYTQEKKAVALNFAQLAFLEHEEIGDRRAMVDSRAYIAFFQYETGKQKEAEFSIQQAKEMSEILEIEPTTWATLVEAYIKKCEQPEHYKNTVVSNLSEEKGYFLRRFMELTRKKPCP